MSAASDGHEGGVGISSQLASLVPSFDPSKDDLQIYQQKVQLVMSVWPTSKLSELVTRLILNTTGSAFAKLQLHHAELSVNDQKSVKKLIELLGGQWGKTALEKRFADAERALFRCNQQSDESHDSYLARADVLWTKLTTQDLKLEDLQAYITLRGAQLSSDDKKRIILDSDNSLDGKLTVARVREAVRMLGTSFFHEMTGQGNKVTKNMVYEQHALMTEEVGDGEHEHDDYVHVTGHEDWQEDEFVEQMFQEGDSDAVFVADFETAASELLQSDEDLSTAYTSYVEARRKLSEKFRSRGFWPISSKGKGKGYKGKNKGKPQWSGRKSLQQRILESHCRLCGRKGHWKGECPQRNQGTSSTSSAAPVTLSVAIDSQASDDVLPQEFLDLPVIAETLNKDQGHHVPCFVQTVFSSVQADRSCIRPEPDNMREIRNRIRNHIKGNMGDNPGVKSLVSRIETKLQKQRLTSDTNDMNRASPFWRSMPESISQRNSTESPASANAAKPGQHMDSEPQCSISNHQEAGIFFATHDTWGILDTGATKTVMGSKFVASFLQALDPEIRRQVHRSSCDVVFRFGNQGTLRSSHALVIPVCGLRLKIAVVPGATPFLLSNTLLRALGAVVDTGRNKLLIHQHQTEIPLKLTEKGLYLIDTNKLFSISSATTRESCMAETYAQDSSSGEKSEEPTSATANGEETEQVTPDIQTMTETTLRNSINKSSNPTVLPAIESSKQFSISDRNFQFHSTKDFSQDSRVEHRVDRNVSQHVQLVPASAASASQSDSTSGRGDRSSQPGGSSGGDHHLRQDPCWSDLQSGLGIKPRLDQMVYGALQQQLQTGTPEGDSIHSPEDRGGRGRAGPGQPSTCAAESQGQGPAEVTCSKGQESPGSRSDSPDRDRIRSGRVHGGPQEHVQLQQENIQAMQERMSQLEQAMHQMIALMSQNQRAPEPTPLEEWDDPWNN